MSNNIYDLIMKGNGITVMSFGCIENHFDLSMCRTQNVKFVKVRGQRGIIILRYSYWNDFDAQRYEKYINKNYQRIEED